MSAALAPLPAGEAPTDAAGPVGPTTHDAAGAPSVRSAESFQSPPTLSPESRLGFPPLSIVPDGDGYLVGDVQTATFLALPEVGVVVLRALQDGATIAQAAAGAAAHAGEDVDVLDFAAVLVESGLVATIDGIPLASEAADAPAEADRSWVAGVPVAVARPFFSTPAWTLYGLTFVLCLAVFVLQPQQWPSFEDFFFYPNPAACVAAMLAVGVPLGAGHEAYHWLAARAVGVAARFSVSRRLFFPVFETDLSQLWSVPRRDRYSPFLAGMAFDTVVLAACLGPRVLWAAGRLDLPPLLHRFLGALVLTQLLCLGWQTLVFLRTDLYAALVTALGCRNPYRVTALTLRSKVLRLSAADAAELVNAHPRDVAVARWFGGLWLLGFAWAAYFFVRFFVPGTAVMGGWVFGSLVGAPVTSATFWQAAAVGALAVLQGLLPVAILAWQRLSRVRRVRAGSRSTATTGETA